MLNKKYVKIPFFIVLGVALGLIASNIFIFSKNGDGEIVNQPKQEIEEYPFIHGSQPYIPDTLSFCGEPVPLHLFDVYESLDLEMLINTYRHSSTMLYIKRANRFFPEIEKLLKENNIPDDMKYLCVAESGLANVISPSGATGFWQFLKSTAQEYKMIVNQDIDERYNPSISLLAAAKYLQTAYRMFGSWTLAAAAYNMGMGGLKKEIEYQKVNSYYDLKLNDETSRYVFRILALKIIMENPERYGFYLDEKDLYKPLKTTTIIVDTSINDLVQFAFDNGINYKMLTYFNPWLRGKSLPNPNKKEYKIVIPERDQRPCDIPDKK